MSDISLKVKLINNLYKLVSEKQNNLPLYHANDIHEFKGADYKVSYKKNYFRKKKYINGFEVEKPFKYGISKEKLDKFIFKLQTDKRTNVSGFGMLINGKLVANSYAKPYSCNFRHVSYSMCKSLTSMAVGIAYDKGLLDVNEKILDIFSNYQPGFNKKHLKNLTIKHLLTMTAAVNFDEISSCFHYNWIKGFLGSEFSNEPGMEFDYNSLNTYMLAAIIRKKTKKTLLAFLNENLFNILDIKDVTWDKCPRGIECGGWGLKLSLIDMLKLGQLYLNNGKWEKNGKEITVISEKWINESLECHVKLNDKKIISGYGYQIWLLRDGSYLFNGVFGQNVYINKSRNIVIATTSSAYDIFPDGKLVDMICKFCKNDDNFNNYRLIDEYIYDFRVYLSNYTYDKEDRNAVLLRKLFDQYMGKQYFIEGYASSILPMSSQLVYSNYQVGIEAFSINIKNGTFFINFKDSGVTYHLRAGFTKDKPYEYQLLEIGGKEMPVAVSVCVKSDIEDRYYLKIKIIYLEEIGNKIFKIYFNSDKINVYGYESPNLIEFCDKLLNENKLHRARLFSKIQTPEFLSYRIHRILAPHAVGKIQQ